MFVKKIYTLSSYFRLALAFARAKRLRWFGLGLGEKSQVDAGCRFDMPWTISTGERCKFERGVWIKVVNSSARVKLGRRVFVGANTEFNIHELLEVGDNSLIAPNCFVVDHEHGMDPLLNFNQQACESAPVLIGKNVWVGANSVLLPGIRIGDNSIVAAGAVVNRDVDPNTIVGGVPAKLIRRRDFES